MNVTRLIDEMTGAGIRIWEEAGQLHYRAPQGSLTEERRASLRDHKDEVIAVLRSQQLAPVHRDTGARLEPFPLTDVQSAYLLGRNSAFGFGGVGCHIYVELHFPSLETRLLETAWNILIKRHDMLRAHIDSQGFQRIREDVPHFAIQERDLSWMQYSVESAEIVSLRDEMTHRVYEPGTWPLFDLRVSKCIANSVLHFSMDFLIADWVSIQIMLRELSLLCHGTDESHLPILNIGFRDYVLAERRLHELPQYERDRQYWLSRLDEFPPPPELPRASVKLQEGSPRFSRLSMTLGGEDWQSLRRQAALNGITASATVMSAFAEVIGMWSKSKRFALNLTLLNRLSLHKDVDHLVGDFTSVNLLAIDHSKACPFVKRAKQASAQLFDDLDHRLYSGIEVMRELSRRRSRELALMPIVFTSAISASDHAEAEQRDAIRWGWGITQTPQLWIDCQAMNRNGELLINWDVRDGVLPERVLIDMFDSFRLLVHRLAREPATWTLDAPIDLPLHHRERRELANSTERHCSDGLLHEGFVLQAHRTPARTAVMSPSMTLSYGELLGRARFVESQLRAEGCRAGDLVAVAMEKGWEQVVAVMATLLVGAAYVPIDLNQPAGRRERILRDAKARIVLTQTAIAESIVWPQDLIVLRIDSARTAVGPLEGWQRASRADDLAYVIYTSGSTGDPKGVMITHRGALNTVEDINRRFRVSEDDRILALANLGFDLSVYDIFGPLSLGACVVLPEARQRSNPAHWAELMTTMRVSVWNSVPAQMQMLVDSLQSMPDLDLSCLRLAMLSGDWIPVALPEQMSSHFPRLDQVSLGGATEASIWSVVHPIETGASKLARIPYGKPLANQTMHVLDGNLRACPDWVTGDLYIGGAGLARGYLNDEGRTAERFIVHPISGTRLYRTGDIGRYMDNGEIEFLGREDFQIKIRGHRIELGEIEAVLSRHCAVAEALVIATKGAATQQWLTAFIVLRPGEDADRVGAISEYAVSQLPAYMLPTTWVTIDSIPLGPNGKVNRAELSRRAALANGAERETSDIEEPEGDLEKRLAVLWAQSLAMPKVGRHQDFFALGGDSLLATKLVARIREQIPEAAGLFFDSLVRQMLPTPTVAALARHLREGRSPTPPSLRSSEPRSPLLKLNDSREGVPCVLIHDGAGRLSLFRELAVLLGRAGPLIGLAITESESYLRLDPKFLVDRRATSYARLLQAQGISNIHVVGVGFGARLALETAVQATEKDIDVTSLTLINSRSLDSMVNEEAFDRLFSLELGVNGEATFPKVPTITDGVTGLVEWPALEEVAQVKVLRELFHHTLLGLIAHNASSYLGNVTLLQGPEVDGRNEALTHHAWEDACIGRISRMELQSVAGNCLRDSAELIAISILKGDGRTH